MKARSKIEIIEQNGFRMTVIDGVVESVYKERKRRDLGYEWFVSDRIRPLEESAKFYKEKIDDKSIPLDDVNIFTVALEKAEKELEYWRKEREWCQMKKNKDVAYSVKD